jgi:dolichol-phosphate mannosyltransferase
LDVKLSVAVPFFNEEDCVIGVLDEIRKSLPYAEILAVDDGSTDRTAALISSVRNVRLIQLQTNSGQSAALYQGLVEADGDLIAMMDGDGQNDPSDIPRMVCELAQFDIVFGVRQKRQDTFSRKAASLFANATRRFVLGDTATDAGCTLKIIRREHVGFLVPFDGLHRYLPAFFAAAGLSMVEIPVNHRCRMAGKSKYTIGGRALRGILDLLGVRRLLMRRIPCKIRANK